MMKKFKLKVREYVITTTKATLTLNSLLTDKDHEGILELFATSSVSEFEITHSENSDFKAVFCGIPHSGIVVKRSRKIVIDIVRPA